MSLIERMAHDLLLPVPLLRGIARKASHSYKTYQIPKRTGGFRTIHHPSKELKALQRWLAHTFISTWPVHDAAYAYRTGRSIRDHAVGHAESAYLVRLDIEEFFPSITARDIDHFLEAPDAPQSDWSSEDRALFIDTVCRFERLTIGAPSSPGLSNALCFELDLQLSQLADRLGLTYTRYADDMFFSTGEKNVLREVEQEVAATLSALDCPGELKLRTGKTRHSSKRGRRQVTGLVLGSDGRVHLGRSRKRFIRREIHRWEKLSDEQKRELAGMLAFAMSIESNFMNALILKYGPKRIAEVRAAL